MSRTQAVEDPRTYRGRSVEELIPKIQDELGPDAIILRRREGLTGGIAGFFQRPFIELEAVAGGPRVDVYDEDDAPSFSPPEPEHPYEPSFSEPAPAPERTPFYAREPLRGRPDGAYVSENLAALARSGPLEETRAPEQVVAEPSFEQEPPFEPVSYTHEFHELRTRADHGDPFALALERAASTSTPPRARASVPSGAREASEREPVQRVASLPRGRAAANIQSGLCDLGVSERFAEELIEAAAAHILPLAPRTGLSEAVRFALAQRIPPAPPLPTQGAAIVLVGPGGAGKTSCSAALLGAYRKGSALPASCATLLAGLQKGELSMLLSPHVMKPLPVDSARATRVLRKTRGDGLLIIDTPQLSPRERSAIRKLASLLGELKPERVVIALPATLGAVAAKQLLTALRPLGANALAVTHADETDQIGVAVEVACEFGLAPEYMLERGRSRGWRLSRIDATGLAARLVQ